MTWVLWVNVGNASTLKLYLSPSSDEGLGASNTAVGTAFTVLIYLYRLIIKQRKEWENLDFILKKQIFFCVIISLWSIGGNTTFMILLYDLLCL